MPTALASGLPEKVEPYLLHDVRYLSHVVLLTYWPTSSPPITSRMPMTPEMGYRPVVAQ